MMQSTSYSVPATTTPCLGDPLDALAVGVDQVRAGLVVGLQVLVVEAGPLAQLAVPGLELLGGRPDRRRSRRRGRGSPPSSRSRSPRRPPASSAGCAPRAGSVMTFARIRRAMSVQPSITRSSSATPPVWLAVKFSSQRCCQPGVAIAANHSGSIGWLSRTSTDDGVRWNTYSSRARPGQVRHALHGRGAGADDRDPLVGQPVHRRAGRVAAGVVVVPAAGVERVPRERRRSRGCPAASGTCSGPVPMATKLRGEVRRRGWCGRSSASAASSQLRSGHLGVEQRVVVEAEVLPDALAVLEDLRRVRVLLGRHVAGLLEQRHVDHRRRVALRPG